MPLTKAQASIEFLILFACFLSAFLLMLPSIRKVYSTSIYAIDLKNAEALAASIAISSQKLSLFEEGSTQVIDFKAANKWVIESSKQSIRVEVISFDSNKSHEITRMCRTNISEYNNSFGKGKHSLTLEKGKGLVLIKNN